MNNKTLGIFARILVLAGLLLGLAACGGTKVLKEPAPLMETKSLATASDQRLSATLDWVIVRNGPGTWAKNADWDEYLIRVRNLGDEPLQIASITITDSLGTRIESGESRSRLVKGARSAKRRYKGEGLTVKAGAGAGTLFATGAATAATAMSVGAAAALGSTALAGAAVAGLALAPVLAVGGVFRGINNSKVSNEIESRQTMLPAVLQGEQERGLDIFFPLTPSPQRIEVDYIDSQGAGRLVVDTQTALDGLHLVKAAE